MTLPSEIKTPTNVGPSAKSGYRSLGRENWTRAKPAKTRSVFFWAQPEMGLRGGDEVLVACVWSRRGMLHL